MLPLSELHPGETGHVQDLLLEGPIRQRLLDLGFTPGTSVKAVRRSPLGDPVAYVVRGSTIALRRKEAERIVVRRAACSPAPFSPDLQLPHNLGRETATWGPRECDG
ncbi:MAG TPA: ferrous iron transport protein A [Firmicutes bacterium]|nr:ferrous iron transport protein A [Bacillota bacterium]